MFLEEFRIRRIDRSVMTRTLENSGTIGAPLVPWSRVAVTTSQLLSVSTLDHLPYAWFIFLVPGLCLFRFGDLARTGTVARGRHRF